jgi:hypothetical protein
LGYSIVHYCADDFAVSTVERDLFPAAEFAFKGRAVRGMFDKEGILPGDAVALDFQGHDITGLRSIEGDRNPYRGYGPVDIGTH